MSDEPLLDLAADPALDMRVRKLIRMGLRRQAQMLSERSARDEDMVAGEMALYPLDWAGTEANRQHYEVPPRFFATVLGPHLKYSCCYWSAGVDELGAAESAMLDLVIARAQIDDGNRILDLGCGWGALALALARRFPNSEVVALSASHHQRGFIEARRDEAALGNLKIVTSNAAHWPGAGVFDRIVSIEMFEHIRNWPALTQRAAAWLRPDGLMFVHVFCHAYASYFFENDITARHFFTGGLMPSANLLPRQAPSLVLRDRWLIPGTHYQRTAEAWLDRLDARRDEALAALAVSDDPRSPAEQFAAWRLFFLITAESFGYENGTHWMVGHYLLEKRAA